MSLEGVDPNLLQDFLTESNELLEQLDGDLVSLESAEGDERAELLNSAFRALHTIKGAASFLGLTAVIALAHAAEDALNKLRKGEAELTTEVMDVLLQAVDIVKQQLADIAAGDAITEAEQGLIDELHAIAEGKSAGASDEGSSQADATDAADEAAADHDHDHDRFAAVSAGQRKLELPEQKMDLLEFMVDDLKQQAEQIAQYLTEAREQGKKHDASHALEGVAAELHKTIDFFEMDEMVEAMAAIEAAAPKLEELSEESLDQLLPRIAGVRELLLVQSEALQEQCVLIWPFDQLVSRISGLASGESIDVEPAEGEDAALAVLVIDGVLTDAQAAAVRQPGGVAAPEAAADADASAESEDTETSDDATSGEADASPADKARAAAKKPTKQAATSVEQTIRVEVTRLEELLNLVGQLVLAKNRLLALGRKVSSMDVPQELVEDVGMANSDLDRLTSELQVGVMRTRMQPLAKLFDRYPRVIRDLARMTDKKIKLDIVGKETEVDKSVLELLADPLVHILRNSCDHGVERPADRLKAGKGEVGTVRLVAEHQGSHVRLAIEDDGKGIDRDIIGGIAVERGLVTEDALAQMKDEDVFRFIFAAGFSTAKQVSDLSGRGVGMDVVNTNVSKMNGQINITSKKGQGTSIEILIPLTVAIMPAMMVGIGTHLYAVPLQSIVEIVKPADNQVYTVHGCPVMRLRDEVLPLVNMRRVLDESGEGEGKFAVVVGVGGMRAGLLVDSLVGQQEIVIKPLDDEYTKGGPFSGATIREDGNVSLIIDVIQIARAAQQETHTVERVAA